MLSSYLCLTVVAGPAPNAAACAALIESCVRSEQLLAVDVLAASDLLAHVCSIAGPHLTDPMVAEAVAGATASLVRGAAAGVKASGTEHAQASAHTAARGAGSEGMVAAAHHCFAGAVPDLIASLSVQPLKQCARATADAVLQTASRESSVVGEQQQASAALLAVLLARSLVVLTDAMDAAAESAGMTPAQLYAR
jgi:hypothetical protein